MSSSGCHEMLSAVTNAGDLLSPTYQSFILLLIVRCCTYFPAAAAEHGCCAAAAASRRRELRLMTDVAESCAPFPLQLHHAHLQPHLFPLPLSLTDTDSTTVLDAHVFSPLHEFGASCPLPKIMIGNGRVSKCENYFTNFSQREKLENNFSILKIKTVQNVWLIINNIKQYIHLIR